MVDAKHVLQHLDEDKGEGVENEVHFLYTCCDISVLSGMRQPYRKSRRGFRAGAVLCSV